MKNYKFDFTTKTLTITKAFVSKSCARPTKPLPSITPRAEKYITVINTKTSPTTIWSVL